MKVYIVMDQDDSSCQPRSGFLERVFTDEEKAKEYCKNRKGRWYEEVEVIKEE